MARFDYLVVTLTDGYFVRVSGDVDLATAPQLAEVLGQFANGTLRVDLSEVTFLDSSGLRTLLHAHRDATRAGRRMVVCGPLHPLVQQAIAITGLDAVLDFEENGEGTS